MTFQLNRRDFLNQSSKALLGTAALVLLGCTTEEDVVSGNNATTVSLDLEDSANSAIASPGGIGQFANPLNKSYPIFVYHNDNGEYIAFSSRCTHQNCTLPLPDSQGIITCGCHQSKFSIGGELISGPASTNLEQYSIVKSGSLLTITL